MSPVYLNPPPSSPILFLEFKGDVPAASSFSYLDKSHASDHHEGLAIEYSSWHPQDKVEKVLSNDKPNEVGQALLASSWPQNYMGDGSGCSYGHSSNHKDQDKIKIATNNEQKQSKKWKPSKIRIMQKMMTTSKNMGDHKLQHDLGQQRYTSNIHRNNSSNNNNNNNGIRVCVDCHTSTTPLWRSGPQGPKTLCNACGIRQRKAKRAAMAAAAPAKLPKEGIESSLSSVSMEAPNPKIHDEDESERSGLNHHGSHPLPLKKRGKITFENITDPAGNSNNYNSYNAKSQRAFPRDEEEGAILLMALSCGLACSSWGYLEQMLN